MAKKKSEELKWEKFEPLLGSVSWKIPGLTLKQDNWKFFRERGGIDHPVNPKSMIVVPSHLIPPEVREEYPDVNFFSVSGDVRDSVAISPMRSMKRQKLQRTPLRNVGIQSVGSGRSVDVVMNDFRNLRDGQMHLFDYIPKEAAVNMLHRAIGVDMGVSLGDSSDTKEVTQEDDHLKKILKGQEVCTVDFERKIMNKVKNIVGEKGLSTPLMSAIHNALYHKADEDVMRAAKDVTVFPYSEEWAHRFSGIEREFNGSQPIPEYEDSKKSLESKISQMDALSFQQRLFNMADALGNIRHIMETLAFHQSIPPLPEGVGSKKFSKGAGKLAKKMSGAGFMALTGSLEPANPDYVEDMLRSYDALFKPVKLGSNIEESPIESLFIAPGDKEHILRMFQHFAWVTHGGRNLGRDFSHLDQSWVNRFRDHPLSYALGHVRDIVDHLENELEIRGNPSEYEGPIHPSEFTDLSHRLNAVHSKFK